MYSEAQKKATMKWKKENIKRVELNLNRESDADIIEYFEKTGNTQGEVKRLVRARIQKQIFTNKQTNLMRSTINSRIIQLEDWIEDARIVIESNQDVIGRTPLDEVKKRRAVRINKYQNDIKKWEAEVEELRKLRTYIEGAYYG